LRQQFEVFLFHKHQLRQGRNVCSNGTAFPSSPVGV
jgi:hypothetical protein